MLKYLLIATIVFQVLTAWNLIRTRAHLASARESLNAMKNPRGAVR